MMMMMVMMMEMMMMIMSDDVDDHDDDGHSHHVSIFCSAMKLLNEGANPNCVVFLRLMCAAIEIFPKAGKGVSRVPKTH